MSVIRKAISTALISCLITLAVMLVFSRLPGMDVPLGWWVIGACLPLAIAGPISYMMAKQSQDIRLLNEKLTVAYEAVKRAAETDHLTGIANRASFDARVVALHQQQPGWFLIVDIDHFKAINDQNSHAHGDAALVAVARTLRATIGPDDIVGRIGGEEFAVFMPGAGAATALAMAEKIRQAVAALMLDGVDGRIISLTVSIGVTGGADMSVAHSLSAADRAMYRAKQDGRDRVAIYA